MKSKNMFIVTLILIIATYIMTFIMPINANAVFTDDFNVTWDSKPAKDKDPLTIDQAGDNTNNAFAKIIDKYKTVITFISAIGAVTMVGVFIMNFMKLGTTSGNPTERSKCITGLIWSGLAAAGLGSVALIVGIFYGVLRDAE